MPPPGLSPEVDLTTRMAFALVDHWPLVAALLAMGYWIFPRVLKASLRNGAGDIIRAIVKAENEAQSQLHKEVLDRRLKEHELEEQGRFQRGAVRMSGIEDEIDDITGSLKLKRHRRRRDA